ncbi:MAG: ATP-binding protein [Bacillota bacterium]|nr:ATP-binding protein [Bacillota bacterium]
MEIIKIFFKILWKTLSLYFMIVQKFASVLFSIISPALNKINRRLRFSISFKITAVYAFILSIILLILSILLSAAFQSFLTNGAEVDLTRTLTILKQASFVDSEDFYKAIKQESQEDNTNFSLFDKNKKLLYSTDGDKHRELNNNMDSINIETSSNIRIITLSSEMQKDNYAHYIQASKKLTSEQTYNQVFTIILLILDTTIVLITILVGNKSSKKILLPIDTMTKTVKHISIQALDTRLDVSGSQDELKDLAETFNEMIDRIQHSYEQQNQFVSDASHELRTPISVIQGYANLLDRWGKNDKDVLEESIFAIKIEAENMKDLVEKLLFLARADKNTQKIEKSDFHLNELIYEVIKETKLINSTHTILSKVNDEVLISADRKLIKQALRIFIDNSIKYTPVNGIIKLNSYKISKIMCIDIQDNGIGISSEDLPHIFDRFYRADKSRTKETGGTGLGLSIAKWIIYMHKGSIEVESKLNCGTKIIIKLPI